MAHGILIEFGDPGVSRTLLRCKETLVNPSQEVQSKAPPDKMYLKAEKCVHGSESKVRLTGFAIANAEGDKLLNVHRNSMPTSVS